MGKIGVQSRILPIVLAYNATGAAKNKIFIKKILAESKSLLYSDLQYLAVFS